jgi:hypothetical protein
VCLPDIIYFCVTTSEGIVNLGHLRGEREIQVHVFVFHLEGGLFLPLNFEFLFELMYFQITAFALRQFWI